MKSLVALVRNLYADIFNGKQGTSLNGSKIPKHPRPFTIESLETRMLLSADLIPVADWTNAPVLTNGGGEVALLVAGSESCDVDFTGQPTDDGHDHGDGGDGEDEGEEDGGDLIDLEYIDETYGLFDYDAFLTLEHDKGPQGGQGGPVEDSFPADALANNNAGASGTTGFTQSETSVIAFGSTVLIAFNDAGSNTGGTNKFTGFSRSTDGGATFTDGGVLPTNAGGDAGDPVLARNNTTGRIYLSTLGFSVSTIQMFRSDDGGATWGTPVNATPGGSSEDKEWVTVDNFAGAGNGNVYLVSRRFGGTPGIYFFRSTDNGDTFGPTGGTLITTTTGNQGSFVAVGPDHSVDVFWWTPSTIQMRKSTDLGVTFGAPVTVVNDLVGGTNGDLGLTGIRQGTSTASGFRSNEFPHAAVNPVNGDIYVTYNSDGPGVDKADIFLVQSTTAGFTWSSPVKVNDDGGTTDQWQPTLAVTPGGDKLGIFYSSRQEDPGNNLFKYYGRVASISGSTLSFGSSFAVSDTASLPEFGRDSVVNSVYMGDYNTAYATSGAFEVSWSDNRDDLVDGAGRKDPNVYYKTINLGLAVTTTTPAAGSAVTSIPTDYVVNFTDSIQAGTVQATDFTVDGIVADSFILNTSSKVTFHFNAAPFSTQGLHTMAMAAGAILRDTDGNPLAPFAGAFRYDTVLLQVTSTVPLVGGVFALPGPLTYDVNFNEAVDPASVQTGDLLLSGLSALVSGVTVLPGNTTARFTLSGVTAEGTLTASIPGGSITDVFGNPGAAFSGTYGVDIDTAAYPTPLVAKAPFGSLIYDPTKTGLINFADDVDTFTLNIDPNQTITVTLAPTNTTSSGLQPRIEIFDPNNVSLGFNVGTAAGQATGLNTRPANLGGIYSFAVTGVGGTVGGYTLQVILNAALEVSADDALGAAQDIENSFITLSTPQASAQRGAVLGQADMVSYTAAAAGFTFEDISATGTVIAGLTNVDNASVSIPIGFIFPLYGVSNTTVFVSSNGLLTFGTANTSPLNADLTTTPVQATIAPFWDDLHTGGGQAGSNVFFQVLGSGTTQHLDIQWNQVRFATGGTAGDTLTFEAQLYADGRIQFNYLDLVSGAAVGNNGASATAGIKLAGTAILNRLLLAFNNGPNAFVGSGISTLITMPTLTPDYYSFSLNAGETATLVTSLLTAGNMTLELRDSSDAVLASTGVSGLVTPGVIDDFAVTVGGTYYARIIGGNGFTNLPQYSLMVLRNAGFDTEDNSSAATAQTLASQGALGAIPRASINASDSGWIASDGSHTAANNNYAVGQGSPAMVLRDYVTFTLSAATPTIVAAELRLFNPAGGYNSPDAAETYTLFDVSATAAALDTTRPAGDATGIAIYGDLGSGTIYGMQDVSAADNNSIVRITLNASAVAALNAAIGSTISLGGAITTLVGTATQTVFGFTSGAAGQVQLFLLTAELDPDWYSITVPGTGNPLRLETSTPGDGPGEPDNTLNPKIELYDDSGTTLLASGVAGPDGRNESILVTGLTPGATYKVRVGAESTKGEYFLTRNYLPVVTDVAAASSINENDTATVTGAFTDPDALDTHTVVINWGGGEGNTTLTLAAGVFTFSVSHQYLDDNPSGTLSDIYTIGVTVTDSHLGSGSGGVDLTVDNVAPAVAPVSGPSSGVRGQPLTFSSSFTDVGTLDTHEVRWDFGDGTIIEFHPTTDPDALAPTHAYATSGVYTLALSIRDDDNGLTSVSTAVTITAVAIQTDPCDAGETALVVGGTAADDTIVFNPQGNNGDISVTINGKSQGVFRPTGHLIAYGQAGNDDIQIAGAIAIDAWLYGGSGNDRLKGGAGASILLGGDGDDQLNGGTGRNILIGGRGNDRLLGGNGDDILIGGFTAYDANPLFLCALLDGWNSAFDGYAVRVHKLRLLLNATTVFDDGDVDKLTGSNGLDWFFAGVGDVVTDKKGDENIE